MAILVSAFILLIVDLFAKSCNQRKRDPSSSTKVLSFCADVKRNQNLPQMGPLSCPNVCFRAHAEHSGVAFPIQGCKHVRRSSALATIPIQSNHNMAKLGTYQHTSTCPFQTSRPRPYKNTRSYTFQDKLQVLAKNAIKYTVFPTINQ